MSNYEPNNLTEAYVSFILTILLYEKQELSHERTRMKVVEFNLEVSHRAGVALRDKPPGKRHQRLLFGDSVRSTRYGRGS